MAHAAPPAANAEALFVDAIDPLAHLNSPLLYMIIATVPTRDAPIIKTTKVLIMSLAVTTPIVITIQRSLTYGFDGCHDYDYYKEQREKAVYC